MSVSPYRRLEAMESLVAQAMGKKDIVAEIVCKDTGRKIRVAGKWSPIHRRYIGPAAPDAKPRKPFFVYARQYDYLKKILTTYENNLLGGSQVHDVVITAGRRAGKSSLVAAVCLLLAIRFPGLLIGVIGKRKEHGLKIIEAIRGVLRQDWCSFNKDEVSLTFANFSKIRTFASDLAGAYNVGGKLHLLIYDEAAIMDRSTYDYMSPSVVDWNGLNIMATTHRGTTWVWEKILQSRAKDPDVAQKVIYLEMSALENTFLSESARRRLLELKHVLSERAYASEVLGQAIPETGLAFPDFSDLNLIESGPISANATESLAVHAWGEVGKNVRALIGCDFNSGAPSFGVVVQFSEDGSAHIVGEYGQKGTTDQFGVGLRDYLLSEFGWDISDVVLVADGSGQWQSPTGKKYATRNPSFDALAAQGWTVRAPNADGMRANPLRWQRLEVTRTLIRTGSDSRHLFVGAHCEKVLRMFRELPMDEKRPTPDHDSPHIHIYDAASYPLFRVWGTSLGARVFKTRLVAPLKELSVETEGNNGK